MPTRVVFIATRDPGYPRVAIIDRGLRKKYDVLTIVSLRRHYAARLASIFYQVLVALIRGEFRTADIVFAGFLAQPLVPVIRLFWRGPIVADAFVSLYDTLVFDKQKVLASSWIAKLCFCLDTYMLKHSDLCFTDTSAHGEYFHSTFPATARIERVWASALDQRVTADRRPPLGRAVTTPFQVFFWGNYIPLQGVETIVEAAALLQDQNVAFTLTGRGQMYDMCQRRCRELGAENICFVDWMTPDQIQNHAAISHVTLGIFGTSAKAGRVIPNKVFQSLAMAIPVITRASPAIDELLEDDRNVYLVPPGDAKALAKKICWVRDHYWHAKEVAYHGHQTFLQKASPKRIAEILDEHLPDLIDQDSATRDTVTVTENKAAASS